MPFFIKEIEISKLRHLENIDIKISDDNRKKHLILTGKNGSGKTTVLENIKKYLKGIEEFGDTYGIEETFEDLKVREKKIEEMGIDSKEWRNSLIKDIEGIKRWLSRYSDGLVIRFNTDEIQPTRYANGDLILAYFNAKRNSDIVAPTSVNKVELQNNYSMDADIDDKFLEYLVYLKTQQSFARNEDDQETVEDIGAWFNNFEKSLKKLFQDESIKLKFEYRNLNFKIQQEGREDFGFNELSDGFSAVLDIVMNLILRMEKNITGLVYDKEGIVLIDEVETHLHIELQKNILPFLTSFFPNIQFIVTTHSPFVISSLEDVVVYDLQKKIQVEDLSSYSYDGIVEGYFNVDKYSSEAKEKLSRYKTLVEIDNKSEVEETEEFELRNYLKGISQSLASEIVYEFRKIELSRLNKK